MVVEVDLPAEDGTVAPGQPVYQAMGMVPPGPNLELIRHRRGQYPQVEIKCAIIAQLELKFVLLLEACDGVGGISFMNGVS